MQRTLLGIALFVSISISALGSNANDITNLQSKIKTKYGITFVKDTNNDNQINNPSYSFFLSEFIKLASKQNLNLNSRYYPRNFIFRVRKHTSITDGLSAGCIHPFYTGVCFAMAGMNHQHNFNYKYLDNQYSVYVSNESAKRLITFLKKSFPIKNTPKHIKFARRHKECESQIANLISRIEYEHTVELHNYNDYFMKNTDYNNEDVFYINYFYQEKLLKALKGLKENIQNGEVTRDKIYFSNSATSFYRYNDEDARVNLYYF